MRADEGVTAAAQREQQFVDAVIAIAITLLALGLPLPEGATNDDLLRSAWGHRQDYAVFAISFVVIYVRWAGHHRVFRHVVATDGGMGLLTAAWLFLVVLTPFATEVLSGDGAFAVRFGFYALVQGAMSLVFVVMMRQVVRAGLARDGTPAGVFRRAATGSAVSAVAFVGSVPLSVVTPWAYACWALVPALGEVAARLRRRVRPAS
ncbi:TMEM175 family protein [Prauserella oleivorans]|uniref:TMEM175 family protein n=1 Tax=Prauserella oleivorans TaxID=1478153 RepID=A0ABW5WCK4_9PSEU